MLEYKHLVDYFRDGCKQKKDFRLGLEWERFTFDKKTGLPLPYDGPVSVLALLKGLMDEYHWQPYYEKNVIIALKRKDKIGGGTQNVSLEPGGQIELSGALQKNIPDTLSEITEFYHSLTALGDKLGIGFIAKGFSDHWQRDDFHLMPKQRYDIMSNYMPKVGDLGLDMMFRTCTIQLNLDYESEQDMIHKMRVSTLLQPLATALFANSPYNDFVAYRAHIWTDTDPNRTGFLPCIWADDFGFETYTDYILKVPMYFVKRNDEYIDCTGHSFKDFMAGKLPMLMGEYPTLQDWGDHIGTAFPEVRLKQFLEMRGADSIPFERMEEFLSFWHHILYDHDNMMRIYQKISHWTHAQTVQMHQEVLTKGMDAKGPDGDNMRALYKYIIL